MGETARRGGALRVIFAVDGEDERRAFSSAFAHSEISLEVFFPADIAEVERLYSNDRADAIVTDLRFHGGALADWLTFWPLPAILLVDADDDMGRVEKTVRDEAALFVFRLPDNGHVRALPLLIRKALNVRESVARQNAHLQMSEHQYLNLLQAIPDIVYIIDGKGNFIYINDAIRSIGYEPSKLIGRHFSSIVHPDDLSRVSRSDVLAPLRGSKTETAPKLFDERRSGSRMTRNLELRLKPVDLSGGYHLGSVSSYGEVSCAGYALPEYEGLELGTVGIIRDVTLRKEHELSLEAAVASKELLLKEVHHRVKNNLQVVSSLLNLQESAIADELSRKVFLECQTQIQTMSMVHEVLYRSSSFAGVAMTSYFERLIDYLSSVYEAGFRGITCGIAAGDITLDLDDAIPVALIVNELVSNCMKHAFPEGRVGKISVSLGEEAERWILEVRDDGVGLGEGAGGSLGPDTVGDGPKAVGIGTELVVALAAQVRGTVSRSSAKDGHGTLVTISFLKA